MVMIIICTAVAPKKTLKFEESLHAVQRYFFFLTTADSGFVLLQTTEVWMKAEYWKKKLFIWIK